MLKPIDDPHVDLIATVSIYSLINFVIFVASMLYIPAVPRSFISFCFGDVLAGHKSQKCWEISHTIIHYQEQLLLE